MKRPRELEDDDSSHDEKDVAIKPVPKIVNLDNDEPNVEKPSTSIQCSFPGHAQGLRFTSYGDYEKHYNNAHTNRCLDCRKNFPSAHILELHIREYHDALTEIRREKGETVYACFVEACGDKFKSHGKRQKHLVKAHMFPPNYFFAVTKFGIDRRQSMLVESRKEQDTQHKGPRSAKQKPSNAGKSATAHPNGRYTSTSNDVQMGESSILAEERQAEKQETSAVDTEMEGLMGAMSSLKFVPRTVRIGLKNKAGVAGR